MGGLIVAALALPALASIDSGIAVGKTVTPFHPNHVSGPDKGTNNCPPCTYGNRPAVQVWVNGDDMKNVAVVAKTLNDAVKKNSGSEFKAFIIVLTDPANSKTVAGDLQKLAKDTGASDIGIAYLLKTDSAVKAYGINLSSDVKNTVLVYKNKKVASKFVNLDLTGKTTRNADLASAISQVTAN